MIKDSQLGQSKTTLPNDRMQFEERDLVTASNKCSAYIEGPSARVY